MKKRAILFIVLGIILFTLSGREVSMASKAYLPRKWAYINKKGEIIYHIPAEHSRYHYEFHEGRARFSDGKLYGFINKKGEKVIPAQFTSAHDFKSGLAQVTKEGRRTYIDLNGNVVAQFISPSEPSYDFVVIWAPQGSRYQSQSKRKSSLEEKYYDWATAFSEEVAAVKVGKKWGYIDLKGRFVIKPQFEVAHPFYKGKALVWQKEKWHLINKQGKFLNEKPIFFFFADWSGVHYVDGRWLQMKKHVKDVFMNVLNFSSNRSPTNLGNTYRDMVGKVGVIDPEGEIILWPKYRIIRDFKESRAAFVNDDDKWGFIDSKGKIIIAASYSEVRDFQEGMAAFYQNRKWGFLNKKGKVVIKPTFYKVEPFSNGLALAANKPIQTRIKGPILEENTFGFINKSGKWVIPPKFTNALSFANGLAPYLDNQTMLWGYIDQKGKVALLPKFTKAFSFRDGRALVVPKE